MNLPYKVKNITLKGDLSKIQLRYSLVIVIARDSNSYPIYTKQENIHISLTYFTIIIPKLNKLSLIIYNMRIIYFTFDPKMKTSLI